MTLLSLASRQIWPQVLGFLHLDPRPETLILLHTSEELESGGPARRLRSLFSEAGLLPAASVHLAPIPHDDFQGIQECLANLAAHSGLHSANCQLHFTGGNKLMALAASEWCRRERVRSFYVERGRRLLQLAPRDDGIGFHDAGNLDPHLARSIEPLALLRCQLGSAEVVSSGQRLTLSDRGRRIPAQEIQPMLRRGDDFQKCLDADQPEWNPQAGTGLEFATAFALLKLGVPTVQRSVRLVPKLARGSGREEGELDLVFNWAGKLWVVDCKDQKAADQRVDQLRTEIVSLGGGGVRLAGLLDQVERLLRSRELHPLKEDLLAVAEVGGLLGRAICVRRTPLPPQAAEFAISRGLEVVHRDHLHTQLRGILNTS